MSRADEGIASTGAFSRLRNSHFGHWNADPWRLDYGGGGRETASGAVYLLLHGPPSRVHWDVVTLLDPILSGMLSRAAPILVAALLLAGCGEQPRQTAVTAASPVTPSAPTNSNSPLAMSDPVTKTDAEWRRLLDARTIQRAPKARHERAFTGALWNTRGCPGTYLCAACGLELFR